MKISVTALVVAAAGLCHADVLFYGGDYEGNATGNPITSQHGGPIKNTLLFDDFSVNSLSTVNGLFGLFSILGGAEAEQAYYEVRKGVSEGNGGALVASGTSPVSREATGITVFNLYPEYRYTIGGLGIQLTPGTYWLTIALDMSPNAEYSQCYLDSTNGSNRVGSPPCDDLSYLKSPASDFGSDFNYASLTSILGPAEDDGKYDFSYGVIGTPVPEPASFATISLALLALLKRERFPKMQ